MTDSSGAAAWHSVHVHYEGRQDALLTECIDPLVSPARTRGLSRWFFLRYWKGGPHVRVRVRVEAAAPAGLWDEITAGIAEYLRQKPSESRMSAEGLEQEQRVLAALEGEPADAVVVYPNNTLVPSPYVPEHDKYGGPAGVALAERFFDASSDAAIAVLRASAGAPKGRLNVAFAMMLTALRGAGYADRDLVPLFAAYARFCERFVPADAWRSLQEKVRRPEVLRQLGGAAAPLAGSGRYPAWLQRWALAFGEAARALHEHAALVLPAVTLATTMDPLQFVLFNYLHTHNNRLGVTPASEAQIACVAHHALAHHAAVPAEDVRA